MSALYENSPLVKQFEREFRISERPGANEESRKTGTQPRFVKTV
jgi:hypothetical protein